MTELGYYVLFLSMDGATILLLCWVRIWMCFKVIPVLGDETMPALARNSIAVSLSLVVFPMVGESLHTGIERSFFWFFSIVIKEAFVGFLIGYSISLLFWVIGGVGFFVDNQRGASMASSANPLLGDQSSPLGTFLVQVLVTLFFVGGGFLAVLDGIYSSFVLWPPVSFFPTLSFNNAIYFVNQFDDLMYTIFLLGAPLVAVMFLAEFGLALVGRFAPQLNVFFLAMPIKSGIAIMVLILYVSILTDYLTDEFFSFHLLSEKIDAAIR